MSAPNADQRERWNTEHGQHWVETAEHHDRMLEPYGEAVVRALAPEPEEKGADIGCGNGATTLDLAARVGPGGFMSGFDLSVPMLELARSRAVERGLANVEFREADAQVADLGEARFDFVASRFGVMFFDDSEAAFSNFARSTRAGGRLGFCCWQNVLLNEWVTTVISALLEVVPMPEMPPPGAPGPFALAEADQTRALLEKSGWSAVTIEDLEVRQWMGAGSAEATTFMARSGMTKPFLEPVDEATRNEALARVAEAIRPFETDAGVFLSGKAWLVTARR